MARKQPLKPPALPEESLDSFHRLLELIHDTVLIHAKGRIVYANSAALGFLGAGRAEELVGRPVLDIVSPPYRDQVRERIRRTIEEGIQTSPLEMKLLRLDGMEIDGEAWGVGITFEGAPATMAVIRDIAERKRAESVSQNSPRQSLCWLVYKVQVKQPWPES